MLFKPDGGILQKTAAAAFKRGNTMQKNDPQEQACPPHEPGGVAGAKKPERRLAALRCALLLALLLIGAGIFAFVMGKAEELRLREDIRVFEPFDLTASYSYIEPILLSEGFAASFHEEVRYCFAMDRASRSYIVAVRAKDTGAYQALYDFTYGNSDTPPSGIILKGMPVKLSEEIVFYAMNAYGSIFGEQIADRDAFRTLFGTQYLDTTQKPAADQTPLLILGLLLILTGAAYAFLYARAGGYRTRREAAKTQYSDQAAEISFRSRLPMGVLGAVLGAALGAVVWIVIGRIGFIAGLAGYPILLFAVADTACTGGNGPEGTDFVRCDRFADDTLREFHLVRAGI
jgi:hypothetical protein